MIARSHVLLATIACACTDATSFADDDVEASGSSGGSSTTSSSSDDTTTTSTSTTTAADDTRGDWEPGFIAPTDAGTSTGECDIWANNCPFGEKCMPYANDGGSHWGATRCSPIAAEPKRPGEPCMAVDNPWSGVDDCDASSMCWNVDYKTLVGVCSAFCRGSESEPVCDDPSTVCSVDARGIVILCVARCDALEQDCREGEGCYPASDLFSCVPDASADSGAFGDPCEFINTCDPGLFCADAAVVPGCSGTGCCSPFCELENPSVSCPGTLDCIPWYEPGEAPPGAENLGACMEAP